MREQVEDYDLEKIILGTLILDEGKHINSLIINSKHFLNKENQNMFKHLIDFYNRYHELNLTQLLVRENIPTYKTQILTIFNLASFSDIEHLNQYQEQLINNWSKKYVKELAYKFSSGEIDLETFKNQFNEIKENYCFKNILNIADDVPDSVYKPKERELTQIKRLDYLLKGLEYGCIYLWTGVTNAGKTTLMTQLAKELLKNGKKVFYFSGEQTAKEFKNYLFVSMCQQDQVNEVHDEKNQEIIDIIPTEKMNNYLNDLLRDKLYLYNNDIPKNNIETMIKVMDEAYNLGVRIFFIDNFMQLDDSEQLEQQTKIMEKFKRYAVVKNVIINLVAHPRKTQFSSSILNIMDISGTQNIANKASSIITITRVDSLNEKDYEYAKNSLARNGYPIDNCNAFIEVLKTKGNGNGWIGLVYDKRLKIYCESRKMTKEEYDAYKITKKRGRDN